MRTISHGILVLNAAAELLLCHATGNRHWDIPKGAAVEGESSAQAALREAREECGLCLDLGVLTELGRFAYRPEKELSLHAVLSERFDTRQCVCSTFFRDRQGRLRPEMDAFRWTAFAEVPQRCAKSMAAVLTRALSLEELLARLVAAGPAIAPALSATARAMGDQD